MLNSIIRFFLENRLIAFLLFLIFIGWGLATAPFNWKSDWFPRDPVAVDAIPDIGENQQIVFTKWMGRSPQDVEDQITYPLTTTLLGVPGVKTIRSSSMFGFSSIYVIFDEDVDFYWSRSRILEKLNSLPSGTLPEGVQPSLGPDATALGQVYWYTLEGRDSDGNPAGGWDPQELRSIQDYIIKYGLSSVQGVSEVASIGGFVKEYQVDVDPIAMRAHGVSVPQIMNAVRNSNKDIGAKTIEINRAEYLVRGLGYINSLSDLEEAVVAVNENVPIRIKDVAHVTLGPAPRRGALDKSGADAVGGVVVGRYGANPLEVINSVKDQIEMIAPGLPETTLTDGRTSKVTVVPFYDRTDLIKETLGTLEDALMEEILITIIVILLMVLNLRASILISSLIPLAVLISFIAMRYLKVDANIVALSGIAIAIGTIADMGIVLSENILRHMRKNGPEAKLIDTIYNATSEVASAVMTAVVSTIISFLPVFAMEGAEGKLFGPLAYTKTFALVASIIVTITLLPAFAYTLFSIKPGKGWFAKILNGTAIIAGIILLFILPWAGILLIVIGVSGLISLGIIPSLEKAGQTIQILVYAGIVAWLLAQHWLPLGLEKSGLINFLFVAVFIAILIGFFWIIIHYYERILAWCLANKLKFLAMPLVIILFGMLSWQGIKGLGFTTDQIEKSSALSSMNDLFPGVGEEFMPSLDEGSFLLMPTSMPHSGVEENSEIVAQLDMAVQAIPEVESVVGKLGRAETALDPAPISMFENVINYKPEYIIDEDGNRIRFKVDEKGEYERTSTGELVPDKRGKYYRNWRDHIQSPDDIWNEISKIQLPGVTAAPKLQPIETRLVMLQTGMRAPMGIKVNGPHLDTIQAFGFALEEALKQVDGVKKEAVFADRIVGKPYLLIDLKRNALSRHGLNISEVQHQLEAAVGGMTNTITVEGRERYGVRVRYARELRDSPDALSNILINTKTGIQIPLSEVSEIRYEAGPQVIKSENTFLQGYVLFDKLPERAEVDVVESAQDHIESLIESGQLKVPAGVSYRFSGSYENQIRAEKRLAIVVPIALLLIFLILYFELKSVTVTSMIFVNLAIALAVDSLLSGFMVSHGS
jgi:Cu(I)/Ag(I) efflux system membrane protein CusA/SilA